jgi:hypothetical protein
MHSLHEAMSIHVYFFIKSRLFHAQRQCESALDELCVHPRARNKDSSRKIINVLWQYFFSDRAKWQQQVLLRL